MVEVAWRALLVLEMSWIKTSKSLLRTSASLMVSEGSEAASRAKRAVSSAEIIQELAGLELSTTSSSRMARTKATPASVTSATQASRPVIRASRQALIKTKKHTSTQLDT